MYSIWNNTVCPELRSFFDTQKNISQKPISHSQWWTYEKISLFVSIFFKWNEFFFGILWVFFSFTVIPYFFLTLPYGCMSLHVVTIWHRIVCVFCARNECGRTTRKFVCVNVCISFYVHLVRFLGEKKRSFISTWMFAYKMRFKKEKSRKKQIHWIKCWFVIRMQCFFHSHISFSNVDHPIMKIWNHIALPGNRRGFGCWYIMEKTSCDVISMQNFWHEKIGRWLTYN